MLMLRVDCCHRSSSDVHPYINIHICVKTTPLQLTSQIKENYWRLPSIIKALNILCAGTTGIIQAN